MITQTFNPNEKEYRRCVTMDEALSIPEPFRKTSDNLRIWAFAKKHNMTINEVELLILLEKENS